MSVNDLEGFFTTPLSFIYNDSTLSGQGKSTGARNYYTVLGLSPKASQVEIEHAYHKMIKEAHFNRSLNRKQIELAYLILTDVAQKAMHDAMIAQYEKKLEITAKIQQKQTKKLPVQTLAKIAVVLFVIAVAFFSFRYGYYLKTFSTGDIVYYKDSHRLLGTIVEVQSNHDFGKKRGGAYKIKGSDGKYFWVPQTDVKASCYKP